MGKPLSFVRLASFALLIAACDDDPKYTLPPVPDSGPQVDMSPPSDAVDGMPDANPSEADLAVVLGAPVAVPTSGILAYTIDVTNNGGRDAVDVEVTHELPGGNVAFQSATGTGWTCMNAGQIVTCTRATLLVQAAPTITVNVTAPATAGTLVSTVTVDSATPDSNTANDMDSATTMVTPPANLAITITDTPDPVAPSGQIVYAILVDNAGPGAASALTVTDNLPAGLAYVGAVGTGWTCNAVGQLVTCTLPALASGADSTITLTATAPASGGLVTNTATVSAMTGDPSSTNNTATTTTTVNAAADLSLMLTDASDPVVAGGTISYLIDVNNAGPNTASGITVMTQLPAGNVSFINATGQDWTCTNAGQIVTCTRALLVMGPGPTITINVRAPATAGTLTATSTVTSTSSDATLANNTDTEDTSVFASANLSLAISDAPDPVVSGGVITYTVTVTNAGPSAAAAVTVTDTIPSETTFMSASGTGWTCGFVTGTVTCGGGTLPAGMASTLTIQLIAPSSSTTVVNAASVTSTTSDPMMANNAAMTSTSVDASADLSLSLSATPEPVAAQSTLTYTINVTNNGPRDATNVVVTNRLPDGNIVFQSATGIGWSCGLVGQIVTCTRASLLFSVGGGMAPTITIRVTTPASFTSLLDQASVTAAEADNVPGNNSDDVTSTGATPSADLSVGIVDNIDPANGSSTTGCTDPLSCIDYTISVANSGPQAATGVSVVLTLPANGAFVNVVGTGWVCPAPVSGKITCTRAASIANGASAPNITLTWKAPQPGGFSILLQAEVDGTSTDPDLPDNIAIEDTTILP